jgi:hypothetical protein
MKQLAAQEYAIQNFHGSFFFFIVIVIDLNYLHSY